MGAMLATLGNSEWRGMPWLHWRSPVEQAKVLPTFVAIEWTYRLIAWCCLAHAVATDAVPRWVAAWVCGTINDMFFVIMPFCDNFWQAQASVMITPRLPLYIVELYATVLYLSTTAARQFDLPFASEAALTGLLAHVFYGVYDINGPPFLWWTWHDADPSISKRMCGAPLGSSMWIITYISLFGLLMRFVEVTPSATDLQGLLEAAVAAAPAQIADLATRADAAGWVGKLESLQAGLNDAPWTVRIGFVGLLTTPLFMCLMGVFQVFSLDKLGVPGPRTYGLTLVSFAALTAHGFRTAHESGALYQPKTEAETAANLCLVPLVVGFYAVNLAVAMFGKPERHFSTGTHQRFSTKSKTSKDIMGYLREDNLQPGAPHTFSKDDYKVIEPAQDGKKDPSGARMSYPTEAGPGAEWYTVQGLERSGAAKASALGLISLFTALGLVGFGAAFVHPAAVLSGA